MLQLTRKTDYGIRLMLEVGAHTDGGMSTAEVARRQEIPYQFLRKVAQTLVAQGLLVSRRGVSGGLSLARPAESITALDIVRAFGSPYLNQCTVDPSQCDRRDLCAGYPLWQEAQAVVERALDATRLSDMVRRQVAMERAHNKSRYPREVRPSRVARKQTAGQQFFPGSGAGEGGNPP